METFELYVVVGLLDPLEQVGGQLPAALEVGVRHLRDFSVQIARGRGVIARGGPRHNRSVHGRGILSSCRLQSSVLCCQHPAHNRAQQSQKALHSQRGAVGYSLDTYPKRGVRVPQDGGRRSETHSRRCYCCTKPRADSIRHRSSQTLLSDLCVRHMHAVISSSPLRKPPTLRSRSSRFSL